MNKKRIFQTFIAGICLAFLIVALAPAASASDGNWRAEYYKNTTLSGNPSLVNEVPSIDIYWDDRTVLPDGVRWEDMSIRWTRTVNFGTAGTYRFHATMDDGMRVWIDDVLIMDQWHAGQLRTVTADYYLYSGDHAIRVEYFNGPLLAVAQFWWEYVSDAPPPPPPSSGAWYAEYYNNQDLQGPQTLVRQDPSINFNWGLGSPAAGINADHFSVRWMRTLYLDAGRYRFDATTDDGVRLWVNGLLIIDRWNVQPVTTVSAEVVLPGGATSVRMEYFEYTGYAQAHLLWTRVDTPPPGPVATATVTSATLNVRQGPGSHYPILTTITLGTVVQLAGYRNATGTWVTVTTPSGVTGWAYSPLLSTAYPIMSLPVWTEGGGGLLGPYGIVVGARYLNVRSAPGMSSTILTTVRGGAVLELIGRDAGTYWLKVITPGGTLGWVGSRYVQTDYNVESLPVLTQ